MISVPLLDDVQAAGLTPMQLAASLREKLKKYVADPRVTVVVTQMNSQRVYIMGEVLHTGRDATCARNDRLQALSTSGFTQFANTKAIYVLRSENGKQEKIPVNYKALLKGESPEQNILLKAGRHNCGAVEIGMKKPRPLRIFIFLVCVLACADAQEEGDPRPEPGAAPAVENGPTGDNLPLSAVDQPSLEPNASNRSLLIPGWRLAKAWIPMPGVNRVLRILAG